jgi:hypothetical protein
LYGRYGRDKKCLIILILTIILYSLVKQDIRWKNMGAKLNLIIAIFILASVIASPLIVEIIGKAKAEPIVTTNTIRIGTVDVDAVKQIIKFQPTADYIAAKLSNNQTTHYNGKVIITPTVNDMINLLKEQKIDLSFYNCLSRQRKWCSTLFIKMERGSRSISLDIYR